MLNKFFLQFQYEYFFESGALPELAETPTAQTAAVTQQEQTNLLLGNVSKIEQKIHDKESISSRFIPHLRRRGNKKSGTNSDTHSGESISVSINFFYVCVEIGFGN